MDVKVMSILFLVLGFCCVNFVVSAPACGSDNCDELDCGENPKGRYKDENNCSKCKCIFQTNSGCPSLKCTQSCTSGFRLDAKRCQKCECCPSIKCNKEVQVKCGNNLKKDSNGCPYCVCA